MDDTAPVPKNVPPLNGENHRPLTLLAITTLKNLRGYGVPSQEINPGLRRRFDGEGLVERYLDESPYKTKKGKIEFVRASPAGIATIEAWEVAKKSKT